ncbi:MotA/TolQ/ExbB proton channel family protein [Leptolyngbya sp. FACHB-261]|uniref:MotA/TolQ/ExbB proton channel family protein n=1 Tax=Leptolyngbya sp. FACHB-261 TaxID=2692806 RepID=UPI0016872C73|nr:MotA/TolQ/ExbB proton channel family protein [Leptolyngbya sp. FACHB-261]MBD2104389.1 MotA/TolQ/ExbB proton channel family protein [Leptolyngbya sp. FACHB-261]
MQILDLFRSGGVVMWPLLAFSILGLAMVLERTVFWLRISRRQERLVVETLALYRRNIRSALFKLEQNADLPIARIFLAGLELDSPNPEEFRLALESAAQAEIPLLKRFNVAFEMIITVSPLLGLLGTVLGLITTFGSLQIGDLGSTQATGVTAGISEALVSTASGLIVAIPILLFAGIFRGFYTRQIAMIQEYGGQLELLQRRRYERGSLNPEVPYASN